MKLEPLFTAKENKLFKISTGEQTDINSLKFIDIPWTTVELEPESYNEEYLAELRDQLKNMDETGAFAVLVPVIDKKLETPEDYELFTNACNHTARRVKDCISVIGFKLPSNLTDKGFSEDSPAATFMDTLAIKHAQYIYFAECNNMPENIIKM